MGEINLDRGTVTADWGTGTAGPRGGGGEWLCGQGEAVRLEIRAYLVLFLEGWPIVFVASMLSPSNMEIILIH